MKILHVLCIIFLNKWSGWVLWCDCPSGLNICRPSDLWWAPGHCPMISKYGPSLFKAVGPVDQSFLVVKNLALIKIFISQRVYELHKTESTCRLSIRDMFHVYLNRFEFHFLRLHIIKLNKFCFFMYNSRVPGIAKKTRWQFIA